MKYSLDNLEHLEERLGDFRQLLKTHTGDVKAFDKDLYYELCVLYGSLEVFKIRLHNEIASEYDPKGE